MAITLTAVAAIDNLMMKPENDFSRLNAIRLAIKNPRFNGGF